MRGLKRFTGRQCILLCLPACAMLPIPSVARSQNLQNQIEEKIPGIPEGYTIVDGDIQMPIETVKTMRKRAKTTPGEWSAQQANVFPGVPSAGRRAFEKKV